jgi:YgiT-type zinc finger domain-containing protein
MDHSSLRNIGCASPPDQGSSRAVRRVLPKPPPYDYGRCPCGGSYESKVVEVTFNDANVVLSDVPQGQCPVCGGRIYKARVLECIERIQSGSEPASEPHPLDEPRP